MRFLDLGCGNGWAAREAARRGARAVGIDASAGMVQRALAAAQEEGLDTTPGDKGPGAEFHVGDFAALQAPDGHFDLAWSMEAVYYALDPDTVLTEVRRVLRTGGVFHMLIDHYEENAASHDWPQTTGVPMVLRSEAAWAQALGRAGFGDVRTQRLRAGEGWKREQGTLHVRGRA